MTKVFERYGASWLCILPLALVIVPFFLAPMLVVAAASFLEGDGFGGIIASPTLANYAGLFSARLTLDLYLQTIKFTILTWAFSLLLGFFIAYFLVFHVRNQLLAIGLFLLCTVPFWTSNIIRMISWIPLLGKEGLINQAAMGVGLTNQPMEFLLFSSFAVVVAYVHQLTIFMIVPIFNSMARIDKRVVEAALDAGASRFDIMRLIIVPMSKSGIALGSIFVVSIVMGDFFVIKVMSGGGSASVVGAFYEDISVLQYPPAAASAVVLTLVVMGLVAAILRTVDIRKEIAP
ncbi:putative spermidine/putrescine transport system permease protein [Enhydrobacter aerosaccus]|uniref:Putative spermidine/putrescine transport system permease protein n=1 Tax=Enhydrobacter aerosaccus TaxID=225324 RepID=A0A1T4R6Z0_9HYPH|nr:ABC transporter permease [Enhydrobacter aerosaccus]SKA11852.1 putative spermidine/putrescine transport system permease protein [Enhydrobacter aerosaccus]